MYKFIYCFIRTLFYISSPAVNTKYLHKYTILYTVVCGRYGIYPIFLLGFSAAPVYGILEALNIV